MNRPAGRDGRYGLRANWEQFALLVVINAFVEAMVGLERSVLPLIAEEDFGLASRTAILSFLISFGLVKAGPTTSPDGSLTGLSENPCWCSDGSPRCQYRS